MSIADENDSDVRYSEVPLEGKNKTLVKILGGGVATPATPAALTPMISPKLHCTSDLYQIFDACCWWPWLRRHLARCDTLCPSGLWMTLYIPIVGNAEATQVWRLLRETHKRALWFILTLNS